MKGAFGVPLVDPFLLAKNQETFSIKSLLSLSPSERKEKLKEISAQFEAILIDTILKTERETEKLFKDKEEDTFGMNLDFYKEFSDYYFSRAIVSQNGLGLQEYLAEQLNERIEQIKNSSNQNLNRPLPDRKNIPSNSSATIPVEGRISSRFGLRIDPFDGKKRFHRGIDIEAPSGTPVRAFMDGKVVFSGKKGGYGNLVVIRHNDGKETYYAHLKEINVRAGEIVKGGEVIGKVGSTGRSTGPHLHFEIRVNKNPVNPERFLNFDFLKLNSNVPIIKAESFIKGGMKW